MNPALCVLLFVAGAFVGYIVCNVEWVSFGKYEHYSYLRGYNEALEKFIESCEKYRGGDAR